MGHPVTSSKPTGCRLGDSTAEHRITFTATNSTGRDMHVAYITLARVVRSRSLLYTERALTKQGEGNKMSEVTGIIKNINEAAKFIGTPITSGKRETHQGSEPSAWFEDENNQVKGFVYSDLCVVTAPLVVDGREIAELRVAKEASDPTTIVDSIQEAMKMRDTMFSCLSVLTDNKMKVGVLGNLVTVPGRLYRTVIRVQKDDLFISGRDKDEIVQFLHDAEVIGSTEPVDTYGIRYPLAK